jgi:hypothetical protein
MNMTKNYLTELRDNIALVVLPVLLKKSEHLEFSQITELCYDIADEMLKSRNNQDSLINNIKELKNENS